MFWFGSLVGWPSRGIPFNQEGKPRAYFEPLFTGLMCTAFGWFTRSPADKILTEPESSFVCFVLFFFHDGDIPTAMEAVRSAALAAPQLPVGVIDWPGIASSLWRRHSVAWSPQLCQVRSDRRTRQLLPPDRFAWCVRFGCFALVGSLGPRSLPRLLSFFALACSVG